MPLWMPLRMPLWMPLKWYRWSVAAIRPHEYLSKRDSLSIFKKILWFEQMFTLQTQCFLLIGHKSPRRENKFQANKLKWRVVGRRKRERKKVRILAKDEKKMHRHCRQNEWVRFLVWNQGVTLCYTVCISSESHSLRSRLGWLIRT